MRTLGAMKALITQAANLNDQNSSNNAIVMLLPDFAKASSSHGLIEEIRGIEDKLISAKQSCDLRFCLSFDKANDAICFGRLWVEGRVVVSAR